MSHQSSIAHHPFPLNVQVLEKKFIRKSCSISENEQKTTFKNINFALITYMTHQRSIVHPFFPLMYKY